MQVYPYKTIRAGKFTKYVISIIPDGSVVVQKIFKGSQKAQKVLTNVKEVKEVDLPQNIKRTSEWALYEARSLMV